MINTNGGSNSNNAQKTDDEGEGGSGSAVTLALTLANALLKETGIARSLIPFTSVPQTYRLMMTCKELHAEGEKVFDHQKLPKVCDMRREGNEFKLYRAMVGTLNSRWLEWFDTSGVEELKLPMMLPFYQKMSVTDEEMLIMFGGKRFSELRTLNLRGCFNITDTSVLEVARRCSNLQSLILRGCSNITNTSVLEVARGCSNLQTLNLRGCFNITDTSVLEVARRCSNLQSLILRGCSNITNTSVLEVARRCLNLQTLNLWECRNIFDASVLEVARGCSNLQILDLTCCNNITYACKNALRQSHPKLQLKG